MRVGRRVGKGKELPIDMREGFFVDDTYGTDVCLHGTIAVGRIALPDGHSCLKPW